MPVSFPTVKYKDSFKKVDKWVPGNEDQVEKGCEQTLGDKDSVSLFSHDGCV